MSRVFTADRNLATRASLYNSTLDRTAPSTSNFPHARVPADNGIAPRLTIEQNLNLKSSYPRLVRFLAIILRTAFRLRALVFLPTARRPVTTPGPVRHRNCSTFVGHGGHMASRAKELQSLPHFFAFFKGVWLSLFNSFVFARDRQKQNS